MSAFIRSLPFAALAAASSVSTGSPDASPPFSLPSRSFGIALAQPNATNSLPITGFGANDTSDANGAGAWGLRILVASDVSLDDAGSGSFADDDVTQLTVLALASPNGVAPDGEACATVWRGLSSNATRDAQDDDGSCEELSDACKRDLEAAGACRGDVEVPSSCEDWISSDVDSWAFRIPNNITETGRFFAHASGAEAEDSDAAEEAYAVAVTNVWPVVLSWGDNSTALRCVRASNVVQGSDEPDDVPDRDETDGGSENGSSGNGNGGGNDNDDDDDNAAGAMRAGVIGTLGSVAAVMMLTL
ncbi:hypothetical protein ACHAQH_006064 [Verticillium albo-atrum]